MGAQGILILPQEVLRCFKSVGSTNKIIEKGQDE